MDKEEFLRNLKDLDVGVLRSLDYYNNINYKSKVDREGESLNG